MKKLILFLLCLVSFSANAANRHYSLRGTLDGNIDFRLDLEEDPYYGIVIGQTTYYRKNGKISKIKVYGESRKEEDADDSVRLFVLSEYLGTKECGSFVITFDAKGRFIDGAWSHETTVREIVSGELYPTDEVFFKPVDIADASGVYKFSYASGNEAMPEYGGSMQLRAYQGNVAYRMCQVTPNIAETSGKMAEIFKNRFYFFVGDAGYDVFAFEDAVFVKRANPQTGPCESFGANADVAGVYIKTDEPLEGDVLTAFDEEIAFGEKNRFSVFQLNELWMAIMGGETTFPDEVIMKDIDGDGNDELIARYLDDRTDLYEVKGNLYAVFMIEDGSLSIVSSAKGNLEYLEIGDGYVVSSDRNSRDTRCTHKYFQLKNSAISMLATKTDAEINNFTIDGYTVKEKEFKKRVKVKNLIKVSDLDGWQEVPGNVHRNETAARG